MHEEPAFSYRTRRGGAAVDPALRRIVVGSAALSVVLILVAVVWSGMKPGLGFGPPPVISAPPGPLRVVPVDPGGLTVPGANEQIMSGETSDAPAQLAPGAPAPALAQLTQDAGDGAADVVAPKPVAVAPVPVVAPVKVAGSVPVGKVQVQLAATVDEAGVKREWSRLQVKMGDLLVGEQPIFMPAVVDGQNIWRLRVGGFADLAAARAFCAGVVARGGPCTVAGF